MPRSGHESHVISMGWTRIIVCHRAYVISSVQRHLVCCLTRFLHGVVMQGCVTPTRCGHGCMALTRCGHGCVTPTGCVTLTGCGHGCVRPTGCGHGCLTWTRCRTLTRCGTSTRCGHWCLTLTRCGRPTRCMTLTKLTASLPLMSTCLPTTPYSRLTCVAHIACMVQG